MSEKKKSDMDETQRFLREFKLLMIDGFVMRKQCKYYGTVFRKYWIVPVEERIYWDSRKIKGVDGVNRNYIEYSEIVNIYKDEKRERSFVIEAKYSKLDSFFGKDVVDKRTLLLDCADELTRNVMVDGFQLLWKEYKKKKLENDKKKSVIKIRVLSK